MALELTTDGATEISTTGDAGTSTAGESVLEKLGDHTESVLGSLFGYYLAFTRIVTGAAIDVRVGLNIDISLGYKLAIQAAAVTTVQAGAVTNFGKLAETNAKNIVTDTIMDRTQIIDIATNRIENLKEFGLSRDTTYDAEKTTGETSTEEWAISKSITSGSYSLNCEESAMIVVGGAGIIQVLPTGVAISGPLIEFE